MLKRKLRFKRMYAVMLVTLAVVIAGCQAVAGIDLNRMLLNSLKVESVESSQSVSLKLLWDEDALAEDEELTGGAREVLDMLSNLTLQLDEVKRKDDNHMSFKGSLKLGGRSFGFGIVVDGESALLTLEGAKKPFFIDLAGESLGLTDMYMGELDPEETVSKETITEVARQALDHVGGYLVDKMPNPAGLSVDPLAKTKVNGEELTLAHVSVKLDAEQMWNWMKDYIGKLQNDREGLRSTLTGLADIILANPSLKQWFEESEEDGSIAPTDEEIDEAVDEIIDSLASLSESMKEGEQDEDFAAVMNKDTFVQADLYVDSKLDIRKSTIELQFKPDFDSLASEDEELVPIEGLSLMIQSEQWNINGDVVVDTVSEQQKNAALAIDKLESKQGYEVLRMFDRTSELYSLLDELEIGKQTAQLTAYDDYPPIITPSGVTLVPLRELASQIGATLLLSGKQITIKDKATGTTIVIQKGSYKAQVNGNNMKLSFPPTNIDNVTYVPARDIAKALGASIQWDPYGWGENDILEISRVLH